VPATQTVVLAFAPNAAAPVVYAGALAKSDELIAFVTRESFPVVGANMSANCALFTLRLFGFLFVYLLVCLLASLLVSLLFSVCFACLFDGLLGAIYMRYYPS
jgi:hypothetical protein